LTTKKTSTSAKSVPAVSVAPTNDAVNKRRIHRKKVVEPVVVAPVVEAVTKAELLADIQRVQAENTDSTLTRNFYRSKGKYSESAWQEYFGKFSDFVLAAGLMPVKPEKISKTAEEKVLKEFIFSESYTYNEGTDTYVTFLKSMGTNLIFSGERHRAMKARYSSMVDKASSINEICRDFQMPRPYFVAYKQAHGWTHDQDPFTAEEHETRSTDDMVKELEQVSRFTVQKEYQKRSWIAMQTKAKKWDEFEHNVLHPLLEAIDKRPVYVGPTLDLAEPDEPFALVISPMDLHYGKYCVMDETGTSYNRTQARQLVMFHGQRILRKVAKHGRPKKIICVTGSDWFHIDNPHGTTTNGTPQDMDGTRSEILLQGVDLMRDFIEMLRAVAPVEFMTVPGNHDSDSCLSANMVLKAWYRDTPGITILSQGDLPRMYTRFGNSLIGFGHGDSVSTKDLHGVMTQEAAAMWAKSAFRYYFTGHVHHRILDEIHGITHRVLSSLSGTDRWHKKKGYVTSGRALQGFLVSETEGISTELISMLAPSKKLRGIKQKN